MMSESLDQKSYRILLSIRDTDRANHSMLVVQLRTTLKKTFHIIANVKYASTASIHQEHHTTHNIN